ncbi:MAG: hypothetical protein A2698_01970 [Candidatus Levybacteria bacterium RIFCSPHIGHO2_01_FULL_42_15]|nr:MAG: hypothetical protein A2698_01970 [Candidatus Levybacteria bacterium RIFCSPHIGHO2_01_FULL_42_15]
MFIPDTNILIYAFEGKEPFASLLVEWTKKKTLALSVIAVAEFMVGATDEEIERLGILVESVEVYKIDYEIGKLAAMYRREFLRKKKKAFLLDCMLAATAKVHNLTLVTVNKADFPMKDIKILEP